MSFISLFIASVRVDSGVCKEWPNEARNIGRAQRLCRLRIDRSAMPLELEATRQVHDSDCGSCFLRMLDRRSILHTKALADSI